MRKFLMAGTAAMMMAAAVAAQADTTGAVTDIALEDCTYFKIDGGGWLGLSPSGTNYDAKVSGVIFAYLGHNTVTVITSGTDAACGNDPKIVSIQFH